ncbi:Phenylalanine--tRNA ligase beta subunit [Rhodovastum atsumiense]|uniref:Phenylalanine--tRNA ligase beta subunit n=1 Tax=Rhodovastum atsumiense TaxID=504468 RepID=A0A5M6ILE6_9PROT|nr:phenylalanine--tRNA ligase subunit beta [Rhodovastum atsumiense]KAA5608388.1 phenylalanine--tRNA ligase subunit beta [Rhodovastum atsumiense]CAH2599967.1 Phenylalanine--tRNA ligase beta subunit [Rhodovastum atsumiense]
MKFTLSWLKTHLDTDAPLQTITDTLTRIGLELEGVEDRGAALAPFRIAHVVEALPHPNADRLRACKVDAGDGKLISVVCGAPNARTGMKAVFAAAGSYIPGTGITLKVGEIRGVQSAGMLLSAREMGLGDDHSGIVDLPEDAPVGVPYATWAGLDDPVIDIAVTPNRGDALAVRGVARDLAAAGLGTLKPFAPAPVPAVFPSPLRWAIEMPQACPWVLGRTIRGLRNGPSPQWLQDRLVSIGLRPINALVDVTNFFTIDLGRPLHVFDADKVSGGVLTFRPGAGETFRALNGKDYTVGPEDCAIADAAGVQSLAGVIGGEATGCDEGTTTVFVEAAYFDPVRIALTGRRHGISSDARARFERGIDPALMPDAIEAATRLIQELCGGEASEVVAAGAMPEWQRTATLRFRRLEEFGGLAVPPDEAVTALEHLGFAVTARDAAQVTVQVPSWRNDVAARTSLDPWPELPPERAAAAAAGRDAVEAECDLIEEVLRLRGLDAVPPVSLPGAAPVPGQTLTPRQGRSALARRTLGARGLAECVTFSFMAREQAALFGPAPEPLRLVNPIASDLDQMRPTPVATLVLAAQRNAARGWPDLGLFEVGPGYESPAPEGQRWIAGGVRTGATPRNWIAPARTVDAMDAKGDVWAVLQALGVPMEALTVTADAPGFYHPGRSGVVRQGPKTVLATFGELHPRMLAALDLAGPAVAFEVFLDAVQDPKRRKKAAPDIPPFHPVRRDFAFLVGTDVSAEAVLRAARGAERTLITGVSLFDVYEGEKLEQGRKSLAIEVVFQPRERTLTDAEIEAACQKVVAAVTKATGAVLRG